MKTIRLLILFVLLFAIPGGYALAQAPIEASVAIEPAEATVGDPLAITVTVSHPAGYYVLPPGVGETWGDFTVVGVSQPVTIDHGDGSAGTIYEIDGRLFAPGTYQTLPLPIAVTDGQGGLTEVLAAPAPVTIVSVLTEGDAELRDLKPQAEIPFRSLLPWLAGAAAVVAAGGAIALSRRRTSPVQVDNRPPHEVALSELGRIESLRLPSEGRFYEHYSLVSDAVRVYLDDRFHIPVVERTTREIAADLTHSELPRDVQTSIISLLEDADMVKFARLTPQLSDAEMLAPRARHIVNATLPQPDQGAGRAGNGHGGRMLKGSPGFSNPANLMSANGSGPLKEPAS